MTLPRSVGVIGSFWPVPTQDLATSPLPAPLELLEQVAQPACQEPAEAARAGRHAVSRPDPLKRSPNRRRRRRPERQEQSRLRGPLALCRRESS